MAVPSDWRRFVEAAGGAYWAITANNGEPFSQTITYKDVNLTGAAFEGGVRAAFEETSAILRAFTFSAPALVGTDTVVTFSITEANVELLRAATDPGAIEQLFFNIKCTPSGGSKSTHFAGPFHLQGA